MDWGESPGEDGYISPVSADHTSWPSSKSCDSTYVCVCVCVCVIPRVCVCVCRLVVGNLGLVPFTYTLS